APVLESQARGREDKQQKREGQERDVVPGRHRGRWSDNATREKHVAATSAASDREGANVVRTQVHTGVAVEAINGATGRCIKVTVAPKGEPVEGDGDLRAGKASEERPGGAGVAQYVLPARNIRVPGGPKRELLRLFQPAVTVGHEHVDQ